MAAADHWPAGSAVIDQYLLAAGQQQQNLRSGMQTGQMG